MLLDELTLTLDNSPILRHTLISGGFVASVLLARWWALSFVRRFTAELPEIRRRWLTWIRNFSFALVMLGLIGIWHEEIRSLFISIVAVAAALAIATKEGILCLVGGLLKMGNRSFTIGDRIEVGPARGDVIDYSLMTTKLLEVGPQRDMHVYTGRTIVIPNSLFLTMPIVNESSSAYVLHVFKIPLNAGEDWRHTERIVLDSARVECEPYLEDARRHLSAIIKDHGLDSFNIEPRVSLHLGESERVSLVVRIPAPNRKKAGMEQAIIRAVLEARGANAVRAA